MKRKLTLILMSVLVVIMLAGCSSSSGSASADAKPKIDVTKMSAEEIVKTFQDAGYPISNVIVYTEETDANKLLGRPNQYISKANFADSRAEQILPESPVGGSLETFNNEIDAKARYDYIEPISKNSMFSQYLYLYDNVLLRIDGALTPSQAAQYEAAFISLQNGDLPEQLSETAD